VEAQNARTRALIDAREDLPAISERLTAIWNYPKYGVPERRGGRTFFSQNDGLQNQATLYVQDTPDSEPRVLIDPNTLSEDGTAALSSSSVSRDGGLIAYGISHSGSDWQVLRVRDVSSCEDLPDLIEWCKFATAAWHPDGSGFFYSRFPDPSSVSPGQESYNNKVYWHQRGTPQAEDVLIYERPDAPGLGFHPRVTEDGRYLFLHVWHGTDPTNRVYYRPLASDGDFVRLLDANDASYDLIDNLGSICYFQTDLDAPRGRIVAIDLQRPERERWQEIVPEGEDTLSFVRLVDGKLVVARQHDVKHELSLYDPEGASLGEIALPVVGSIAGWSGRAADSDMYLALTSFLTPATIYRYDFASATLSPVRAPALSLPVGDFEVRQVFFSSKDGTRIPMFLVHRKGLELNGDNPTLLYAYGGFNISLTPQFWAARLYWVERGGVFAVANLRGGSEYGEAWHEAGMLERKQNVFDDFIAAAEWLATEGYTRPERLAIAGGSNGGLLVAACMLQRPELFGAVHCAVPVIDMLRYHRFTVGRYWVGEYGNAEESAEQFRFMLAYSPLHNVREGVKYPPVLITTADTDDRVVPAHAYKFAATLQHADPEGQNQVFLRVDVKAGHGAGKPTAKLIEEQADVYAFLFGMLGV
jgi:prolyl oligopeptidase